MENHENLNLSELRKMIIRYGAKYMESSESDLYYDCREVGELRPGESVYWFVSGRHTHLYSATDINNAKLSVESLSGDRFNYKITCREGELGFNEYSMTRMGAMEILKEVK